ncbi:MAG: hypothetical protein NTX61_16680 [Bacteroidetes bacterium]|nr:hypothetical protein [Bacteroidota bacterium]
MRIFNDLLLKFEKPDWSAWGIQEELAKLLRLMVQVYDVAYR